MTRGGCAIGLDWQHDNHRERIIVLVPSCVAPRPLGTLAAPLLAPARLLCCLRPHPPATCSADRAEQPDASGGLLRLLTMTGSRERARGRHDALLDPATHAGVLSEGGGAPNPCLGNAAVSFAGLPADQSTPQSLGIPLGRRPRARAAAIAPSESSGNAGLACTKTAISSSSLCNIFGPSAASTSHSSSASILPSISPHFRSIDAAPPP